MDTTVLKRHLSRLRGGGGGGGGPGPGPGVRHVGVYASDRLPERIAPSTALVVNTEPHTRSGEHWVAFYRPPSSDDTKTVEYFDSFGRPPYQSDFQRFLRRNINTDAIRYVYNRYRLQGPDTSVCGQYCLTYLYCRTVLGATMNDFVQLFDFDSTDGNDALVRRLFAAAFHRRRRRLPVSIDGGGGNTTT